LSRRIFFLLVVCASNWTLAIRAQEQVEARNDAFASTASQPRLEDVVREAFRQSHDGWSTDEVLIRDELNRAFIARCHEQMPGASEQSLNWTLLNLRKAGNLHVKATRRDDQPEADASHVAEIAARSMQDKHEISIDAVMADPDHRREFDELAQRIDPEIESYAIRKAALRLRKTRNLRPELITRIADWDRQILELTAAEAAADLKRLPENPGVYMFRDRTGYLYIGEAINLRERLTTHLDHSDHKSLAHYLGNQGYDSISLEIHYFPVDSRMKEVVVRRAYESELIRSREPRFNVRP
jgi:hypothetical protein